MRRTAHVRWLRDELPGLVAGGVLSDEAAGRVSAHYGEEDEGAGARLVVVLFGVLGAVLIGGGVILLLGHNWDELSRPVRAALSIAPLAGSLALAAWVIATGRGAGWREPAGALWTLSIGASVSLISQTYHLPGDWPSLLTVWLLLAAPIPYLLRSVTAAFLYCLGALSWVIDLAGGPGDSTWFWGFVALLAPFVVLRLRRDSEAGGMLLAWAAAVTLAAGLLPSLELLVRGWWEPLLVTGLVALWAGGELAAPRSWAAAFRVVGGIGTIGTALVLSFEDVWDDRVHRARPDSPLDLPAEVLIAVLLVAAAVALTVAAARRRGPAVAAIGAALPVTWCAEWLARTVTPEWPSVLVNLYLIALGVALLVAGVRETSLGRANLGAAVLGLLTLFRFFDTEWSFVVRGAVFIAVGLGFVAVNVLLMRRRRDA